MSILTFKMSYLVKTSTVGHVMDMAHMWNCPNFINVININHLNVIAYEYTIFYDAKILK
jgi:hypothetical protein